MLMRVAVLAAVLSGCAVGHIEHDARTDTADALPIVLDMWSETLGVDLYERTLPEIRWHDLECLNDSPEFEFDGGCLLGQYNGTDDGVIDLVVPSSQRISDSSLAHELLHWALDMAHTRPDPLHADPEWKMVDNVNDVLWNADF